jgi:putative ABC transport system permease protein
MIRHLLRLVWNRKRSNLLITVEILLSFIVLTAVTTLAVFYVDNYRRPLGYDVQDIWVVSVQMHDGDLLISETSQSDGTTPAAGPDAEVAKRNRQRALMAQLLRVLRDMPEVQVAAAASITPYSGNTWNSDIQVGGRRFRYGASAGSDELARALGLQLVRGRWFAPDDDGASWDPVVINERLAREMFPDKDPVGQFVSEERPGEQGGPRMRIVGVIGDFRKDGEYAAPENFLFNRISLDGGEAPVEPVRELVIRVRPGTTAAFEERAVARLLAAAPDWTFQAEALTLSRETALRFWLAPLGIAGTVSVFLLLMVAMGLTGVLWLHITQRTREIGLRRAKGATVMNIQHQLVGEVAILTTLAVAVGVALVIQLPILQVFDVVTPGVYAVSITVSLVLIFVLTTACAWVPSRLAGAVQPAEALRYE